MMKDEINDPIAIAFSVKLSEPGVLAVEIYLRLKYWYSR